MPMSGEKIVAVIEMYEMRLRAEKVPKMRIDPRCTFGGVTESELLEHAHYLCEGAKGYARDPAKYGKANRHLTAIQMCLSLANWYTLAELMEHNRRDGRDAFSAEEEAVANKIGLPE